nr:hypothetical protein [Rhodoferax sp.]
MVASIQSTGVSQGSGARAGGDASAVALQAQLTRCERQLGDWEACASSKTPEGRKIIENLRARIGTLESKIAGSGKGTEAADPTRSASASDLAQPVDATDAMRRAHQAMGSTVVGSLLDVFA